MWARSYTLRAVLAIAFLFGYYAVALLSGLALLLLPIVGWKAALRVPKLGILSLVGGAVILWSVVPRRIKFEPPGPRITEADQPELFRLIREVAEQMQHPMPAEVYLFGDVNAFVARVGGFLGIGGRHVMALGIPLLAVDSVGELKATIAHEFGHYKGGETKLSPLIYATRSAMIRTVQSLGENVGSVLAKPFEWVLRVFLRVTQAISRQQELLADVWSVRIAGKAAHVSGLRNEALHGQAFGLYMENEVSPLMNLGAVPERPFAGFGQFLGSTGWKRMQPQVANFLREQKSSDPFDSHPALDERIAFAESLQEDGPPPDDRPAWSLVANPEQLEQQFLGSVVSGELQAVSWKQAGLRWAEAWKHTALRAQVRVPTLTSATLPTLLADAAAVERAAEALNPRLIGFLGDERTELVRDTVANHLGAWIGSLLASRGYEWEKAPGEPLQLTRGEERIDPVALLQEALTAGTPPAPLATLAPEALALQPSDEDRAALTAPRHEVAVAEGKKGTELTGSLAQLFLPWSCAICLGKPKEAPVANFRKKAILGEPTIVELAVPVCEAHLGEAAKAFELRAYDDKTGKVTLAVPNAAYAELIRRANA